MQPCTAQLLVPMRLERLDVLRAIAVFLVFTRHVYLVRFLARAGWIGVDLFFVLSGFLVSGLLFAEQRKYGHIAVSRFWLRRAFKILPPFYVLLIVSALTGFHQHGHVLADALFVQDYVHGWWHHTWSLAIEEHFYLLLPLALVALARRARLREDPFAWLPYGCAALAMLVLALRIVSFSFTAHLDKVEFFWRHLCPTHLRIDSLASGVFLSWICHYRSGWLAGIGRRQLLLIAATSALLLLPCTLIDVESSMAMATIGLSFVYLGFGGILLVVVLWPQSAKPSRLGAMLAYIGRHSYSIYLWHLPIMLLTQVALEKLFPHIRDQIVFVVFATLSVAAGVFMTWLVEAPALRLRDRLLPARRGTPSVNADVQLAT